MTPYFGVPSPEESGFLVLNELDSGNIKGGKFYGSIFDAKNIFDTVQLLIL